MTSCGGSSSAREPPAARRPGIDQSQATQHDGCLSSASDNGLGRPRGLPRPKRGRRLRPAGNRRARRRPALAPTGQRGIRPSRLEHVRDDIRHSWDVQDTRVSISASDTLAHGTGLCFAKAHLLAAVLRSQGVPTGFCYQRLTDDGATFMLHGLVAVFLNGDWHRQDAVATSLASTPSSHSAKNAWPGWSGRNSANATTIGSSPRPARKSSKPSKQRPTFSTSAAADFPATSDSRCHSSAPHRGGGRRWTARGEVTQP